MLGTAVLVNAARTGFIPSNLTVSVLICPTSGSTLAWFDGWTFVQPAISTTAMMKLIHFFANLISILLNLFMIYSYVRFLYMISTSKACAPSASHDHFLIDDGYERNDLLYKTEKKQAKECHKTDGQ